MLYTSDGVNQPVSVNLPCEMNGNIEFVSSGSIENTPVFVARVFTGLGGVSTVKFMSARAAAQKKPR